MIFFAINGSKHLEEMILIIPLKITLKQSRVLFKSVSTKKVVILNQKQSSDFCGHLTPNTHLTKFCALLPNFTVLIEYFESCTGC